MITEQQVFATVRAMRAEAGELFRFLVITPEYNPITGEGGIETNRADYVRSASMWGSFPVLDRKTGQMQ